MSRVVLFWGDRLFLDCGAGWDHTLPVVTFYLFLLGVGAVGALAYMGLFLSHVPGAKDERLGALPDLPDKLGKWVEQEKPSEDGLLCEKRHLLIDEGGFGGGKLLLQVRYRNPQTREIMRIEKEQTIKRRRVRS